MGHPLYSKIKVCKKWFTDYIYKIWKVGGHITEISGEIEVSYKKTIEKHDFKSINSSETSCKYHNQMIRD